MQGQPLTMANPASDLSHQSTARVGIRPEAMTIGLLAGSNQLTGTVEDLTFLGPLVRLRVRSGQAAVRVDLFGAARSNPPSIGDAVTVYFQPDRVHLMDANIPV